MWVLDHGIPIDAEYYLNNQLSGPLTRIFEAIIPKAEQVLLHGDHTRVVVKSTPSAKLGGIMSFAVKKETCMGERSRDTLPASADHKAMSPIRSFSQTNHVGVRNFLEPPGNSI